MKSEINAEMFFAEVDDYLFYLFIYFYIFKYKSVYFEKYSLFPESFNVFDYSSTHPCPILSNRYDA